jgi:hypothetical protein
MTIEYPYGKEFPEESRRRIRVEEIMAGRDFERAKQDAPTYANVEDLLRTYILRVFLVFVKEGSELVRTGAWGIVDLESESLEFLRRFGEGSLASCRNRLAEDLPREEYQRRWPAVGTARPQNGLSPRSGGTPAQIIRGVTTAP